MAKDLAIILNNGSLNSAVATALGAQKYRPILLFLETAAKPGSRAHAAYEQQIAHFKPYREHTVHVPFPLNPHPAANNALSVDPRHGGVLAPYLVELLPLISTAARFAAHYQASAIYLGLRVGAGPDDLAQVTEYVQIWNELLQLPCAHPDLEVVAPLLELEPWQVVDVGHQVGAPLERGWSCLEEGTDPCWACRGCRAREAAFTQAGKPDPLRQVVKKS